MARRRTGFAWLIELATSAPSAPFYLCAANPGCPVAWTRNHDEAKRFGSEAEAKMFAGEHVEDAVRVCEHGWS